jgi:hypothetical protein
MNTRLLQLCYIQSLALTTCGLVSSGYREESPGPNPSRVRHRSTVDETPIKESAGLPTCSETE